MSKDQTTDLLKFLSPFDQDTRNLVLWLRGLVSIAVGRTSKNIHFGFYHGSQVADPEKILIGNGNQYRYILIKKKADFPWAYLTKLIDEAYVNALAKVKDPKQLREGLTITKMVATKKREKKVPGAARKRSIPAKKSAPAKKK